MDSLYYSPEKWGLRVVAEFEYEEDSYSFDTRVVWKHESGKFYTARDSGCSCPAPFEDYRDLTDLDELINLDHIREELTIEIAEKHREEWKTDLHSPSQQKVSRFLDRLAREGLR